MYSVLYRKNIVYNGRGSIFDALFEKEDNFVHNLFVRLLVLIKIRQQHNFLDKFLVEIHQIKIRFDKYKYFSCIGNIFWIIYLEDFNFNLRD